MIWGWIALAIFLSWFICDKNIPWYHYIWMLLPVEMYGINIAGATLKPYMIYGFGITAYAVIKNRGIKLPLSIVVIAVLLMLSDVVNGFIIASIMQHLMVLMIIFIALEYLVTQDKTIHFEEISKVAIATTIGYGIVFTAVSFLFKRGVVLPDVYTDDRYLTGMIYSSLEGFDKVSVRLRGFCIDPNGLVTTLIPGATFGLANLLYRKESRLNKIKSCLAVGLFFLVVFYSGSRMALLSSFVMASIMFFIGYRQAEHKMQWIIAALTGSLALMVFVIVNRSQLIMEIYDNLEAFFTSRALLTDDAGRLTIWRHNLRYLERYDRLLTGVGQNQISNLTAMGKACHNTWLEWICGTGLIVGTFINIFFLFAPVPFSKNAKKLKLVYKHDALPIILAYIVVLIAITSVDNIANSVMILLAILFRYGIPSRKLPENTEEAVAAAGTPDLQQP